MTEVLTRLTAALADRYRIERELGQGGMATVYLARDLKHERDVAIKVLKPELGAVLGVERFLSEIKVTANLQHPNLLPLFDSGEAEGLLFYVMPYVEGETLRARLERERQLPVEEAIRLSVAIAQALDYAHRRGVIHRDLKPENILLPDGQPLVADFGIALAVSNAGGQRVTQTGLSLGTPQYMSPEQATGDRAVDARTDIYSLAAMTYEMLTGEPPHGGTTAQAIIARLMTEDVRPLTVLRRTVPAHVDAAVRHALEKLAADRFATASEYAQALQGKGDAATLARYVTESNASHAPQVARTSSRREAAAWAIAAVAVAAVAWVQTHPPAVREMPVVRAPIDLPVGEELMVGGFPIAMSTQGDQLAYITQSATGYRTIVQRVDELGTRTELAPRSLRDYVFSPDGRFLAYWEGSEVRRLPVQGGTSELIADGGTRRLQGLAWTSDGTLVVGSASGVFMLPAMGTEARGFTDSVAVDGAIFPVLLPDQRTVIVRSRQVESGDGFLAISLANGKTTDLKLAGGRGLGVLDDHFIYVNANGDVAAVEFDASALRVRGEPIVLETGVEGVGFAPNGSVAFRPVVSESRMVVVANGRETAVRSEVARYQTPRFSPDGRRIAVEVSTLEGSDIWVQDRVANTFTRLTTGGASRAPEWTGDGKRIIYRQATDATDTRTPLMSIPVDGSAQPETLFVPAFQVNEVVPSPDGRWLLMRSGPSASTNRDIFAIDLQGDKTPIPLATGATTSELMPRLSPDGEWLAYQSDLGGRTEIYVRPFPGDGARVQLSDAGGSEPMWDRSGRRVYYRAPDGITAVSLTLGATVAVGARQLVLPGAVAPDPTHQSYDVLPDGSGFLVLRRAGGDARAIVVHNWQRAIREKLQRLPR